MLYDDGSFTQQMLFSTGSGTQPNGIDIGDFDQDNRLDLMVSNSLDGSLTIFLRDSSQPFLTMTTYSIGNDANPRSIAVADLNNDSNLDIIVANYGSDNIGLLFGYGNGTF